MKHAKLRVDDHFWAVFLCDPCKETCLRYGKMDSVWLWKYLRYKVLLAFLLLVVLADGFDLHTLVDANRLALAEILQASSRHGEHLGDATSVVKSFFSHLLELHETFVDLDW